MKKLHEIKDKILAKYGFTEIDVHNVDLDTAITEIAYAVHRQACEAQRKKDDDARFTKRPLNVPLIELK